MNSPFTKNNVTQNSPRKEHRKDFPKKKISESEANRRFLTLTVYAICAAAIFFVSKFTYQSLHEKQSVSQKSVENHSDDEFYPPGWEFLDPKNNAQPDFRMPDYEEAKPGEAEEENRQQTPESHIAQSAWRDSEDRKTEESEMPGEHRYVVAKILSEMTETPEGKIPARRSPLEKIYEQKSLNGESAIPPGGDMMRVHKPITDDFPDGFLEPPRLEAGKAEIAPATGRNAGHISDTDVLPPFFNESAKKNPWRASEPSAVPYTENGPELLHKFHRHAQRRLAEIKYEIQDYYCILYKWDQTNILSQERDVMHLFLRESPFSVYARYEYPLKNRNREFIFWSGHYEHALIVNTGEAFNNRTLLVAQDSPAMRNSATHGVTDLGFRKLLEQLIEISGKEEELRDAKVRYYQNARVGNRACYALEVTFPERRPELDFCRMEVMVDKELDLPIRVAMYDWGDVPEVPGPLMEEYIYVIKGINIGLEDIDFCYLNSHYRFREFVPRMSPREKKFQEAVLDDFRKSR